MKSVFPIELGRVVLSTAGRDEGRLFVVVGLPDDEYALIADGDLRKAAKPKRKKRRHLRARRELAPALREKLVRSAPVEDYELRAQLTAIKPLEEE